MQPSQRDLVLSRIAAAVVSMKVVGTIRLAIDGVDGSGKTFFADELATCLMALGKTVIRASADDFHNPREVRYRQGRDSPAGFYADTYNYPVLISRLLGPLGPKGSRRFCRTAFNVSTDRPNPAKEEIASPGSILVFDGMFLHRPELRHHWDFSVFLAVPFDISIPRGASRGEGWGSSDPNSHSNQRYVEGQKIYLRECEPEINATVMIDNSDLAAPKIGHFKHTISAIIVRRAGELDVSVLTQIQNDG